MLTYTIHSKQDKSEFEQIRNGYGQFSNRPTVKSHVTDLDYFLLILDIKVTLDEKKIFSFKLALSSCRRSVYSLLEILVRSGLDEESLGQV